MHGQQSAPRHLLDVMQQRQQGCLSLTPLSYKHAIGRLPSTWSRMALDGLLKGHKGCVNHVQFNESGTLLASGSDDTTVILWDVARRQQRTSLLTPHTDNIFCVQLLPGDDGLATCAGDGKVCLRTFESEVWHSYPLHEGRAKKLVFDSPHTLLSCGDDGFIQRLDMRSGRSTTAVTLATRPGQYLSVNSIASPRYKPWLLAAGGDDDVLRVYDLRMVQRPGAGSQRYQAVRHFSPGWGHPPELPAGGMNGHGISGVCFSDDGAEVLGYWMGSYVFSFSMGSSGGREADDSGLWQAEDGADGAEDQTEESQQRRLQQMERELVRQEQQELRELQQALRRTQRVQAELQQRLQQRMTETQQMQEQFEPEDAQQQERQRQQQQQQRQQQQGRHSAAMQRDGSRQDAAAAPSTSRSVGLMEAVERLEAGQLRGTRQQASLASSILTASQSCLDEGNVAEALRLGRAALLAQPTLGRAHYQVAVCLEIQGELQAALQAAESAMQLAWSNELQRFTRRLRSRIASEAEVPNQPAGPSLNSSSSSTGMTTDGSCSDDSDLEDSTSSSRGGGGGSAGNAAARQLHAAARRFYPLPLALREGARVAVPEAPFAVHLEEGEDIDLEMLTDDEDEDDDIESGEDSEDDWAAVDDDSDHGFFDWGGEPGASGPPASEVQADEVRLLGRALAQLDAPPDNSDSSSSDESDGGKGNGTDPHSAPRAGQPSSSSGSGSRRPNKGPDYLGSVRRMPQPGRSYRARCTRWYKNRRHVSWAADQDVDRQAGAWRRYMGACNVDTYKDCSYAGPDQQFVVAGGDGGHLFVWERSTGKLITCVQGDKHAINCIKSHPHEPLLASCGIGTSIKIWTPCLAEPRRVSDQLLSRLSDEEMMRIAGTTVFSVEQQLDLLLGRRSVEERQQQAAHALKALGCQPGPCAPWL